jgi:hypothetical protein
MSRVIKKSQIRGRISVAFLSTLVFHRHVGLDEKFYIHSEKAGKNVLTIKYPNSEMNE